MKSILVFIDGTICDTRHRNNFIGKPNFYSNEEILKDLPTPNSVNCIKELSKKYKIIYIGARPDFLTKITEDWLNKTGFPQGDVYLAEYQEERVKLAIKLKHYFNFIAGIGDRWDDNELHLEIGCLSIILKEYEGNWDIVRKNLL